MRDVGRSPLVAYEPCWRVARRGSSGSDPDLPSKLCAGYLGSRRGTIHPRFASLHHRGQPRISTLATRSPASGLPPSKEDALEAVMRNPALIEVAACIPESEKGGRPRDFPNWVYVYFGTLISHFSTAGKTESELASAWEHVRALARDVFPGRPELWPGPKAIRRHRWKYIRDRYLTDPEIQERALQVYRLAVELGNVATDGRRSLIKPDRRSATVRTGR